MSKVAEPGATASKPKSPRATADTPTSAAVCSAAGSAAGAAADGTTRRLKPSDVQRAGGGFVIPTALTDRVTYPAIVELLDPERDDHSKVPYQLQGNKAMETPEALRARAALRQQPGVVAALERFCDVYDAAADGSVDKAAYSKVHAIVAKALLPKATDEQLEELAARDWVNDAGGASKLTRDQLMNAVFQLVDIWSTSLDVAEYLALLNALRMRVNQAKKK